VAHGLGLLGRISLAALFGYLIGVEREYRGKPAGERTFALLALGGAAFTAAAVDRFTDADRVLQGIVTGVGFLGAGLVFRGALGNVHNVTTAATIWPVAAVGVLVGLGDLVIGLGTTLLVLVVLELEHLPGIGRFVTASRHREPDGPAKPGAPPPDDEPENGGVTPGEPRPPSDGGLGTNR
jgi:putative Mg2+ transporter-C (MgtC) family protein